MHIWANPPVERIPIFAKFLGTWVLDHIGIWKPGRVLDGFSGGDESVKSALPGSVDSISTGFWLVEVSQY